MSVLDVQHRDGVAYLTLARPEKRNALSLALQQELSDALWDADERTDIHCAVISGQGMDFCAGYDLAERPPRDETKRGAKTIDDDIWQLERQQRLRMTIFDMHKPVIAAIHGRCLAGGTDLAFLADMVVAADDATIAFPPARDLGSLPNQMWLYHCGPQWAKRLLLTGDSITGKDAAQIGLVLKSVPADELTAEVEHLAQRLAMIDPDLLTTQKRIVNLGLELMGARTLQRLACENDARGHRAKAADTFRANVRDKGLKAAFAERDDKFGAGFVDPNAPEHGK